MSIRLKYLWFVSIRSYNSELCLGWGLFLASLSLMGVDSILSFQISCICLAMNICCSDGSKRELNLLFEPAEEATSSTFASLYFILSASISSGFLIKTRIICGSFFSSSMCVLSLPVTGLVAISNETVWDRSSGCSPDFKSSSVEGGLPMSRLVPISRLVEEKPSFFGRCFWAYYWEVEEDFGKICGAIGPDWDTVVAAPNYLYLTGFCLRG